MNVLVVCEDHTKDHYVLKPILQAMLQRAGRPRAHVRFHETPRWGVQRALRWDSVSQVIERYRSMVDMFLVVVDRDGLTTRREVLDGLEKSAEEHLRGETAVLLAEHAWQEVEAWALAGLSKPPKGWTFARLRREPDVKSVFQTVARELGLDDEPGGGRDSLGREAARHYRRVVSRCSEDVGALEARIREVVKFGGQRSRA